LPEIINNWFGDLGSTPSKVVPVGSAAEIAAVLKDEANYPSPVRAIGSGHSCTECCEAEGGTALLMRGMASIKEIGDETLRVEAGAIHLDMARALAAASKQFYVNTEIGSLTAGSAACCGTKDASMPDEFGMVGSYVTGVRMIMPDGTDRAFSDAEDPATMQLIRCSYGTFGVIHEVTFRIRQLRHLKVYHETFTIGDFINRLGELFARNESMMYYIFPFEDLITVEFRTYQPDLSPTPNRTAWFLRNLGWANLAPRVAHADSFLPRSFRNKLLTAADLAWRATLETFVRQNHTVPADQIIGYPTVADHRRYTFTFCAFPEAQFGKTLADYVDFVQRYDAANDFRPNMSAVGYRVLQDRNAQLSYAFDGNIMTIDPVSTGDGGWKEFLAEYNAFCDARGGVPLFNQTFGVTRAMADKAFGSRIEAVRRQRSIFDPGNRLLNSYFRILFA
jgi:FAD/FMN-containing dehydrogenase